MLLLNHNRVSLLLKWVFQQTNSLITESEPLKAQDLEKIVKRAAQRQSQALTASFWKHHFSLKVVDGCKKTGI